MDSESHNAMETNGIALNLNGSPTSGNSSDMFMYDDSSMSDGSLYASDQENHSVPRKRLVFKNIFQQKLLQTCDYNMYVIKKLNTYMIYSILLFYSLRNFFLCLLYFNSSCSNINKKCKYFYLYIRYKYFYALYCFLQQM